MSLALGSWWRAPARRCSSRARARRSGTTPSRKRTTRSCFATATCSTLGACASPRVTRPDTPSTSLRRQGACDEPRPVAILTGDFVFVSDVGRPDLLERAANEAGTKEASARQLFLSLSRIRKLPDYLQIWPAHGAGSACGKALGDMPSSTVGYERMSNWAFSERNVDSFVDRVLEGQPEPPAYFGVMKHINREGPPLLAITRRAANATRRFARRARPRGCARRRCSRARSLWSRPCARDAQHSVGRVVHDARRLTASL